MRITEIFLSIQGESTRAGWPCVFVRTTGCNLRCVWCDTEYSFHGGREMSVVEVLDAVEDVGGGCRLVEITGGEPLLQHDVGELAERLLERGYTVLCETGGSVPVDRVPGEVVKIMDLKAPGSGEAGANDWSNLERLSPGRDEIKFVLADRGDYEWAVRQLRERGLDGFTVHFSPVHGRLDRRELAEWILEDGLPVRLNLQIHKMVWDPEARGV
jgi:7-carboxy-7-deazaguanine synthase